MSKSTLNPGMTGLNLLQSSRYNKGTAFSEAERAAFGLHGLLPHRIENIEEQKKRGWLQYCNRPTAIAKNLFLNQLARTNATLFYAFVEEHLTEMLPVIYTPTIGEAVQNFSNNFTQQQGLVISYPDMSRIDGILASFAGQAFDIIVVTDGEGVLGIGDQGIGGLDIAIGKLMVYTLCGGVNPFRTLPVMLDVGTNNQKLLDDPLYLGWRHTRISGDQYAEFIECFTRAFKKHFPRTLLHWEDFGRGNARAVLDRYRLFHPSFNDDIQGTGAVALAAVLAGIRKTGISGRDHRFCIFGAGTAGTGIADQICRAIACREGISEEKLRENFFLIDRNGLLQTSQSDLQYFQRPYAKTPAQLAGWKTASQEHISLLEAVFNARPTVLIGCSTVAGAFTDEVISTMAANTPRPVIMPLSNPTEKAEATPQKILELTGGKALIATGSPFGQVNYAGRKIEISQCNNALIFPGIGLGMIISEASSLSDGMLLAASEKLADLNRADNSPNSLLPGFSEIRRLSAEVALAVARQAAVEKLAQPVSDQELKSRLKEATWCPVYADYCDPTA